MSDQQDQRLETLAWIREQGIEAYPARTRRTHTNR
jgi:lysyl-tRNA synthetase class II